jgi:hypothetical protein
MATDNPEHSRSWRRVKALIFLLIGMSAIGWLVFDQRRAGVLRNLTSTGTLVQARIKEMNTHRGGNLLTLCYEFSAGGSAVEIRDRKVADFDGLQPQGTIDVWYDPADPRSCVTRNELRHPRYGATPFLFAGLIVLVMAAAALQTRREIQPARDVVPGD